MNDLQQKQQDFVDNFNFFESWQDKYRYLIELGQKLPPFPAVYQTDEYLVKGCQSRVWFHCYLEDGKLTLLATSDAAIVKGLIAMLLEIYDGQSPADVLADDAQFIVKLGLDQHLSPTRSNGLFAMLKRIREFAAQHQENV